MTAHPDPAYPPPNFRYGDAWEYYPVRAGELWGVPANRSVVAVHDLFDPLPPFMLRADMVFSDPPWLLGNINCFYTKAGRTDYLKGFDVFETALFGALDTINPPTCYLEIGRKNSDAWEKRLRSRYPHVERWAVTYNRKHPCVILRGSRSGLSPQDYSGWDEAAVIKDAARVEEYSVLGDLCMGQGLVGLAAYAAGKSFVGTDINARRLAVLLKRLAKRGAVVGRHHEEAIKW